MKSEQLTIRDEQRDSWNEFSTGWRKWDNFTMHFLHDQRDQMIQELQLNPTDRVLDIASGTGEPGLTMAATILHSGSVMAIDISEGMLQIAQEKANAQSIKNFHTLVADVCELPFEDASFDAISCRLGFMFFPDMKLAAKEMLRVLQPGGRIVTTVWAEPDNNLWITAMMGAISNIVGLPSPPTNAPGMFRCAQPGFLTTLFKEAGASGGIENVINGEMLCNSTDEYWEFMNDVVPPVVSVFKKADGITKDKIRQEVYNLLDEKIPGIKKNIPFGARLFKAVKVN
jgi:ubiquinone/menaquinone biosynthesis C-methylase UbiE